MFTALAILLAVPLALQLVTAQNSCTRTYTVVEGDICDGISAANNVSTFQLGAVNSDVIDAACDNLQPGCTLCLGWPGQDCTTTYVVQDGDTCDGVAYAYGINTTILYTNNPQLDQDTCDNLYIGEVVCVSSTVQVPPAPSGTMPGASVPPTTVPSSGDLPYCDEMY